MLRMVAKYWSFVGFQRGKESWLSFRVWGVGFVVVVFLGIFVHLYFKFPLHAFISHQINANKIFVSKKKKTLNSSFVGKKGIWICW